ncbi:hypothetical protein RND71_028350 [Anisodus tanguticus]|uniref:Uncharacterized protein n=1 Tax=Anisodus tanguticus TaxID=243964 RepID=A0AAE1RLB7_9SOLA|nr:hypothetical protein RND71_028350 [Anisodus tanguticus]
MYFLVEDVLHFAHPVINICFSLVVSARSILTLSDRNSRVDHLVNTVSLGHTFYLEEATETNLFPILMAAKAAVINFYETLRLEVKDDVGITIATHGWVGTDITRGKFMMEEGADMLWKEEREVRLSSLCGNEILCLFQHTATFLETSMLSF